VINAKVEGKRLEVKGRQFCKRKKAGYSRRAYSV
jgi:hypothetical protein